MSILTEKYSFWTVLLPVPHVTLHDVPEIVASNFHSNSFLQFQTV